MDSLLVGFGLAFIEAVTAFVTEDKTMHKPMTWRPATYVKLASLMTLIVAISACASKRVSPEELSQEVPQSAFNEDNWDAYRSEQNVRTYANKKAFKNRVKNAARTRSSAVAGQ